MIERAPKGSLAEAFQKAVAYSAAGVAATTMLGISGFTAIFNSGGSSAGFGVGIAFIAAGMGINFYAQKKSKAIVDAAVAKFGKGPEQS